MLLQSSFPVSRPVNSRGFALIASISIMAVLVLIGVTLYSLSSVATKSADIAKGRTEAQANARMSLAMALGELQQLAGLDTRVTASSDFDFISDPEVSATGVWRS